MLLVLGSMLLLPLILLVGAPALMTRHVSIGPIVLFPHRGAMYGALNVRTRWGYLCLRLPTFSYGRYLPGYLYASPNATPWAAWWGIGRGFSERDRRRAADRRAATRMVRKAVQRFTHDEAEELVAIMRRGASVVITIPAPAHAIDPVEYGL
jgi:hypothetical protein